MYNEDILAHLEASGFGLTAQDVRMTRISTYHGYGSQVRISIYAEQTVLFVAKYGLKEIFTTQLLTKKICTKKILIFLESPLYGHAFLIRIIV